MDTISKPMVDDHRRCDDLYLAMEKAVSAEEWNTAMPRAKAFEQAMLHHFSVEEERLFPALESASPQAGGPVNVMTMEHVQMRHMIEKLVRSIEQHTRDEAMGIAETLLMTIQQHNMKEENILYPMADRFVPEIAEDLAASIPASVQ